MTIKTFTIEDPALPMHYPGFVVRRLRKKGHDVAALLDGTGLTEERLGDPNYRFAYSSLRRLTVNAMVQTGDPHLGPRLGRCFDAGYIGLPAYAAMTASTLQDALDVFSRYFFLAFPSVEFAVFVDAGGLECGETAVRLRSRFALEEIAYFISGFALAASDVLLKKLLNAPQLASRAEMTVCEPVGWAAVAVEVGFPVRFDAPENRLIFPSALLAEPLPCADPINHARLVALCENFATDAGYEATLVSCVVSFLEEGQNLGAPLSEAAAALGYSERGLRRKLQQSGTSYRKLIEQVRESRARQMLSKTRKPITAVAHELGYETASNFARSFKRWTGSTPKEYRESWNAHREAGQN
ncbi:MAG: AraC family transcriptional regulator [Pseudomonadota bacterium]